MLCAVFPPNLPNPLQNPHLQFFLKSLQNHILAHKPTAMATYTLTINGEKKTLNVEPDTALLWVLREHLRFHLIHQTTGPPIGQGQSFQTLNDDEHFFAVDLEALNQGRQVF